MKNKNVATNRGGQKVCLNLENHQIPLQSKRSE